MTTYTITFQKRETLPERLEAIAGELDLTPEQLIKRFISAGIAKLEDSDEPSVPGETLEDFLVQNGVWKPENR
ncbi:MAG: hypothetical protein ACTIKU_08600 [Halomonas sp.]|uniref:hypothetical protein n=1 Tax=unclassified Halomonas TaxID=2609666 RepID=UPI003CECBD37